MESAHLESIVVKLRDYATSWKVTSSRTNEGDEFFQFAYLFRAHQALGFTQLLTEMSTRSRKIMFLASRVKPVHRADNLTAICEPIV
jgi:hypothetical protein